MNYEQITTFLDVIETRNFNATAERLGLTQSTVSHRIAQLEAALGKELFTRGRGGAAPTAAGHRFETHARNMRREWQQAKRMVYQPSAGLSELRIGIQHDLAKTHAGAIVSALREQFPLREIYIEVDYSRQMTRDVERGVLDAALVFTPRHLPDHFYEELAEVSYKMVSVRKAALGDITDDDYIFPNISPLFAAEHRLLLPQFEKFILACGNTDALAQFLWHLGGATYLAAEIADRMIAKGGMFAVKGAPELRQKIYFNCHIKYRHQNMQNKMLAAVRALFKAAE